METIRSKPRPRSDSARTYRLHILFCVLLGVCFGCFIAYAEQREWLPRMGFDGMLSEQSEGGLIGICLTQAAPLVLLFILGLHRPSYYYTSQLVCLCFGFGRGTELFRIISKPVSVPWSLILFCALLGIIIHIFLSGVLLAAKGVTLRHREQGASLPSYIYHALRLFGALLIAQFVLDTLLLHSV